MSIVYRIADCGDLDGIYEIEKTSFLTPWSFDSLKHDVCEYEASLYMVALEDDQVVGFCGTHIVFDECHINNVAVKNEFRRRGIAKGMINFLFDSTKHISKLYWLEVRKSNTPAKNLYESFGFKSIAIRPKYYSDTKEDATVMLKEPKSQSKKTN